MSQKELQSLREWARRSLRSARNILDDGAHDFVMSHAYQSTRSKTSRMASSTFVRR